MITLFDNETILRGYTQEKILAARREGMMRGERRKAIEATWNLVKEGLPVDMIARALTLSIAEVNDIKSKKTN